MKLNHFKRKKYFKKLSRKNKRIARAKLKEGSEFIENVPKIKEIDLEELMWLERDRESHEHFKNKLRMSLKMLSDNIPKHDDIISIVSENIKPVEYSYKVSKTDLYFVPKLPFDLPYHNPFEPDFLDPVKREICHFYRKTGVCRFDIRCSRVHESPVVSDTIVFINMFNANSMERFMGGGESDLSLEFDENELLDEYDDFYADILTEFASFGKVITIRTCRNGIRHLRGNVYVQYKNINDSVYALSQLNGRFYGGIRLCAKFVTINSWRESICGLFIRGHCPKGKICNFLHVLLNPGEKLRDLYRFMSRSIEDHKTSRRSVRYRSRSRTCSSVDDVSTPEQNEKCNMHKKHDSERLRTRPKPKSKSRKRRSAQYNCPISKIDDSRQLKRKKVSLSHHSYSERVRFPDNKKNKSLYF